MLFAHVNIIANDWKALSQFYIDVFGCTVKPPVRKLSGDWLERGTGVKNAAIEGVHLLLPGYGTDGPTLEIFSYTGNLQIEPGPANQQGFRHIAFKVKDLKSVIKLLLEKGGSLTGEITEKYIEGVGTIAFVYARDPEGNILEIQRIAEP